jgi:hypothetical protein
MNDHLKQAISLIKSGDQQQGRQILEPLVEHEPNNEVAWMWLAVCVDSDQEKTKCLERALTINPSNARARQALDRIKAQAIEMPSLDDIAPAKRTRTKAKPAEEPLEPIEPPPSKGLTIEFPYSSSQTFPLALERARKYPTFKQFRNGKKAIYRVTFDASEMGMAFELIELLKGWRQRVVYIDGERKTWDSVFAFIWCYQRRQASYKPESHCFGEGEDHRLNLWGCAHTQLDFEENSDLFRIGHWLNKEGDWQIDKEQIRHRLNVDLYEYRFCPAMRPELIDDVLDALPDVVNPNKDKDWTFVESWDEHLEFPEALTIVTREHGYASKVAMAGACPNGRKGLRAVTKRMKHKVPVP